MRPEQLNRRITLQKRTTIKGTSGGMSANWEDVATEIRAKVTPLSGNERRATDQGGKVPDARTEFAIWYRPGVTEDMRIAYRGRIYDIRHVKDVNEEHKVLILTCDNGVNDG